MAKIMLVEDDNNLREIYEARLMAEGYEIVTARDGEEALAVAVKERPDLVISDVMMPKISGFDMLDILRSTPETKNVKVIMMTALSQVEDKERATKLGADRYLVKSQVTLEDVAKVAREVLEGTPAAAPSKTETAVPPATAAAQPAAEVSAVPVTSTQPTATPTEPVAVTEPAAAVDTPITPVVAPTMGSITMPTPPADDTTATTDNSATSVTSDTAAPVDGGITDLSSTPQASPLSQPQSEQEAAQEEVVTPPALQDNDIVKPAAEVWALDAAAPTEPPVESNTTDGPAESSTNNVEVASAEAKIEATGVQSLEDEEAAIAKQIETMIGDPAPAADAPELPLPETAEPPTESAPEQPNPAPENSEPATNKAAPVAEPASETEAPTVESKPAEAAPADDSTKAGQKVIQPLNDPTKPSGPDIHELAAKEEAIEAGHVTGSVISPTGEVSNPTATGTVNEPKSGAVDPNSLAL